MSKVITVSELTSHGLMLKLDIGEGLPPNTLAEIITMESMVGYESEGVNIFKGCTILSEDGYDKYLIDLTFKDDLIMTASIEFKLSCGLLDGYVLTMYKKGLSYKGWLQGPGWSMRAIEGNNHKTHQNYQKLYDYLFLIKQQAISLSTDVFKLKVPPNIIFSIFEGRMFTIIIDRYIVFYLKVEEFDGESVCVLRYSCPGSVNRASQAITVIRRLLFNNTMEGEPIIGLEKELVEMQQAFKLLKHNKEFK